MSESDNFYTAFSVLDDDGFYIPEIYFPTTLDAKDSAELPEFRLGDESVVRIIHDPKHPWEGLWGAVRVEYATREPDSNYNSKPIKRVQIIKGVWECDPRLIIKQIMGLQDKVRRRNRQIEGYRRQLLSVR